jgi:hypothetical protein
MVKDDKANRLALDGARARRDSGRLIPTDASSTPFADDLDRYLDRLLDEALGETFPASDATAVPTRRQLEKNR